MTLRPRDLARRHKWRPRQYPDKFVIIYADPPWSFRNKGKGVVAGGFRSPDAHYKVMELDDIAAMPVKDIAAKDAILFMWTTNAHLQEALRVIKAWGFEYKTNIVWTKDKIGFGFYIRNKHELLLIAERGNFRCPKHANRPHSHIIADRRRHSQKPDEAYEYIERMYPNVGPKIELFARNTRPGWFSWGNEIRNSPKLFAA